MKNVTFSADEADIETARSRATSAGTTLNEEFRRWLREYARSEAHADQMMDAIRDLQSRIRTGGKRFTRAERNER
jgi:hypothetical protein